MKKEKRSGKNNQLWSVMTNEKWLLLISILFAVYWSFNNRTPSYLAKFDYQAQNDFETKWGTYRSGHYFGLKKNVPYSLVAGLMWFKNKIEQNNLPIKHWCNQFDRLSNYSWLKHDFDHFGIQELIDSEFIISTKFVNFNSNLWSSQISVQSNKTKFSSPFSLLFYFATENPNDNHLNVMSSSIDKGKLVITGSYNTNTFRADINIRQTSIKNVIHFDYLSTYSLPPLVYLKETILTNLSIVSSKSKPNNDILFILSDTQRKSSSDKSNFVVAQIIAVGPVEIDVVYNEADQSTNIRDQQVHLNQDFDKTIAQLEHQFDNHFENVFGLKAAGFDTLKIKFAQSVVSNMLGSIGHFHGYSSVVGSDQTIKPSPYGPLELMTAVPSRSFFPRGFLWDEGFHNLLISKFNPELSSKIIKSWLNLINVEGWIPREVILGLEAEARVPKEFVTQKTSNGNPPTLFLTLNSMIESNQLSDDYLKAIFPKLQLWYDWYQSTQSGLNYSTYRWRGRDQTTLKELNPKTLTSGLDDYPRSSSPSSDEIHLDLRCWMAFAAKVMYTISSKINHQSVSMYKSLSETLHNNDLLNSLHWSNENQMYCDWGWNSLKVRLRLNKEGQAKERRELIKANYSCIPEVGYVSLFPLLLNILDPDNPKLGKVLSDLRDPEQLWTPFGIRSLSKKSQYYNKYNTDVDPPYWRGPIWININFLALKALHKYSQLNGVHSLQAKQIYNELRSNLIENVFKEYFRTGFIWEQYDDITGHGKGSHPFTGWSALIVLIMAERY